MPVLVAAARHGLVPSLWVSGLSVLAYNFFFLPPLYQFTISDPANVVALFFFMLVAVVASALAARTRSQTEAARARGAHHRRALCLQPQDRRRHRPLRPAVDRRHPSGAIAQGRGRDPDARATASSTVSAAFPPDGALSEADLAAARWSWDADRPTGRGTDTLPGARWLFVPIRTSRSAVGVIGVLPNREGHALGAAERSLLDAVGDQAAVAIERARRLAEDIDQARLGAERERAALGHADLGVRTTCARRSPRSSAR